MKTKRTHLLLAAAILALTLAGCDSDFGERTVANEGCGAADAGASVCEDAPADECISDDELRLWDRQGICVDGECEYTSVVIECDGLCDDATAECVCPSCDDPPPTTCSDDGQEQIVYDQAGQCTDAGGCHYPSESIPCQWGCDPQTAQCDCPTCDEPPADTCVDDDLVVWDPAGTCIDSQCEYDSQTIPCQWGCDPQTTQCDCPTCDEPPADECVSDDDLLTWQDQGSCVDAECEYDSQTITCQWGCDAQTNACACPPCDEPPAAQCVGSDQLEVWDAAGRCEDEQCQYDSRTIDCPHGCDAATNRCTPPPLGGEASTWGTEFWVAFMDNVPLSMNGPPKLTFLIGSPVDTSGQVEVLDTGLTVPFSVSAGQMVEVDLDNAAYYPKGPDTIDAKGIRVVADDMITLTAVHKRYFQSDATLVLPIDELGDEYVILASEPDSSTNPSQMVVLAVEDGTQVDITPSAQTVGLRAADQLFTVSLDAGEVYQMQAGSESLSGTLVETQDGKPVAVFSGSAYAEIECRHSNHTYQQNPPTDRWGREYVLVPFKGQGRDLVEIVAQQDGTEVRIDCGSPVTLDRGEVHAAEITDATRITSSAPVAVAQFNRGQACNGLNYGDPSLLIPAPTALQTTYAQFRHTRFLSGSDGTSMSTGRAFFNLLGAPDAALVVDGTNAAAHAASAPGGYVAAQVELGRTTDDHVVSSEEPFSGTAYGFADKDAYTFQLGYDCTGCLARLDDTPSCP